LPLNCAVAVAVAWAWGWAWAWGLGAWGLGAWGVVGWGLGQGPAIKYLSRVAGGVRWGAGR
jgi:hypothetical protein